LAFLPHLQEVVRQVEGAVACGVMGFDGISVETHEAPNVKDDMELGVAWVEFANLVGQLQKAAEPLKTGAVTEVSVNTERVLTVMRILSPEYFLFLALKPEGNYGKGRYALRVTAPKVKAEL
jgi:predicted regulator of Ras-like GTPase activity (Roadblock/LC7/MglB family)